MQIKNLIAYLNERFPLVNMLLFSILFFTVHAVSTFQYGASQATMGATALWGVFAVIFFFFRLRVFDEIKDYNIDALNHPQRVLQSGRISLKQLKTIALIGTFVELSWSAWMGTEVVLAWLLAAGFSLLMRYEFFIGKWLRRRLLVYAFSHMLIMPLIIAWIWMAFSNTLNVHFFLLAALSLLAGFSFEIARKIHAPQAEKATIESYSKAIGYRFSIVLVLLLLLAGTGVQYILLQIIGSASWPFILIGLLYLITLFVYTKNLINAHEKSIRKAELGVSLFMLVSYVSIIVEANF